MVTSTKEPTHTYSDGENLLNLKGREIDLEVEVYRKRWKCKHKIKIEIKYLTLGPSIGGVEVFYI